jgi:hypothetical protein
VTSILGKQIHLHPSQSDSDSPETRDAFDIYQGFGRLFEFKRFVDHQLQSIALDGVAHSLTHPAHNSSTFIATRKSSGNRHRKNSRREEII